MKSFSRSVNSDPFRVVESIDFQASASGSLYSRDSIQVNILESLRMCSPKNKVAIFCWFTHANHPLHVKVAEVKETAI